MKHQVKVKLIEVDFVKQGKLYVSKAKAKVKLNKAKVKIKMI